MTTIHNEPTIGEGIYPINEVASILKLPYYKVNRWIDSYWDGEFSKEFENKYSWKVDGSKAINFYTLIELFVMMRISETGVKPKQILLAHQSLTKRTGHPYPFALKQMLEGIRTDGKTIFLSINDFTVSLNGTHQINLDFIEIFFKKLDFDADELATRFWPLGKDRAIVIDPGRKLGAPIIDGRNIYPETLYNHVKAGDPIPYLAHIYDLTESEIQDALEYCEAA